MHQWFKANTQLGSDMDPAGTVYVQEGRIRRAIKPTYAQYYSSLLENSAIQSMLGQQIVETAVSTEEFDGNDLILEHRKVSPLNYCYEWPSQMLQDAALLTLEICLRLSEQELILKDATPWNVLFDGPRPIFVDFTSINPQEPDLLWVGYDQFCRLFLFPLTVASFISGRVSRTMLLDSAYGITDSELAQLLPSSSWWRKPWLLQRLYLPRIVVKILQKSGQDKNLSNFSKNIRLTPEARRAFFRSLYKDVASLSFSTGQSYWSKYYEDISVFFRPQDFHAKQAVVATILDHYNPQTVVDIGCNQGGYAIMAALNGVRVVAFDTDEDSVGSLYQLAKKKQLDIMSLVMDVTTPSPQCGWRGIQYPAAPVRLRAEMAFALALVHHLAITHGQTFERIVQTLGDYCEKWLLTEFVPLNDARSLELMTTHRRDMTWYSLENFLAVLQRSFSKVETFPSYPDGRTVCFCQK